MLATTWGATQWTAWRLAFQPELGPPWFFLGSWPVYVPPAFFWWRCHFDAYAPKVFVEGAVIAASGGFAAIAVAIVKKRLGITASLHEILQILSLTLFEKTELFRLFHDIPSQIQPTESDNQLNLFD